MAIIPADLGNYARIEQGGYFDGNGSAHFSTAQTLSFTPTTQNFKIELAMKYVPGVQLVVGRSVSHVNSLGFSGSQAGKLFLVTVGSTLYLDAEADVDADWHVYEIEGDTVNVYARKDGVLKDTQPVTALIQDFEINLLLRRQSLYLASPIQYIKVSVDGELTAFWDFGLANSAGSDGPDAVYDLIGANHAAGVDVIASNWRRDAVLPANLDHGYNYDYNAPDNPIPASRTNSRKDANGDSLVFIPVIPEESGNYVAITEGGFFQGNGQAYFALIDTITIPYTKPFKLTFRHQSTYNGYDAIIGYKATNAHRIFTNNGELTFAGVLIDIESDADSLWHTYELIFDGSFFNATKDGSPIGSTVPASIATGNWVWDQLLAYHTIKSQNAFHFIEIEIDGVLTHRWDFGLANAAGNSGPQIVYDRIGLNDGIGNGVTDANWQRTADLSVDWAGYNLYYPEPNHPIPPLNNDTENDIFGQALEFKLSLGYGLTAEPGLYTYAGAVANLLRAYLMAAIAAGYVLTGPAIALLIPRLIGIAANVNFRAKQLGLSNYRAEKLGVSNFRAVKVIAEEI
jgi:hypothetical protein